jgi:hypothetical protein
MLFKEVVSYQKDETYMGKNWVIEKIIDELSYDSSLLGLSLYQVLSKWLKGTYSNEALGNVPLLKKGIKWLITGDRSLLDGIDIFIINAVSKKTTDICREYLETVMDGDGDGDMG